jgi:type IV pilus assembly protein PilE
MTTQIPQVRSLHALRRSQAAGIMPRSGSSTTPLCTTQTPPPCAPLNLWRRQRDCYFNRPNSEYGRVSPTPSNANRGTLAPSTRRSSSSKSSGHKGFSLIELMIVVGAVAILAAIVWPSYQNYVLRANRSAAQQFMLDIANREEQYMLDARSYAAGMTALSTLNMTVPTTVIPYYTISVADVAGPPVGYTITATATGTQSVDGNLTLDSIGAKTPSNKW